jgi:hypothetical protein
MPEAALEDLLEPAQRIDTDDVRAEIAKEIAPPIPAPPT